MGTITRRFTALGRVIFVALCPPRWRQAKMGPGAKRSLTALMVLASFSTVLVSSPSPAAAQGEVPVTVTILHWQELDNIDDSLFELPWGDAYAVVKIDGQQGQTPVQNADVNIFLHPSPVFTVSQSITRMVPAGGAVPIRIELWDRDSPSNDDRYNISSQADDAGLDLMLDVAEGTWTGDNGANSGFTEGVEGFRARVWFDIALGETGDIDGDGLPDGVERFGIRSGDGSVDLDLGGLGAHPCRKSIVVEVDWFEVPGDHTHRPEQTIIDEVVTAFDQAPVEAVADCPYTGLVTGVAAPTPLPAPTSGVDLILDLDSAIEFATTAAEPVIDTSTTDPNLEEFTDRNLSIARRPYVHYALWAHSNPEGAGGQCCGDGKQEPLASNGRPILRNQDFVITRGDPPKTITGRRRSARTFMHELGHGLGLGHGGNDPTSGGLDPHGINFKPNYRSVMSYLFPVGVPQFSGAATITDVDQLALNSIVDFSRRELPTLSERSLVEADGIDRSLQVPPPLAPMTYWWAANGGLVAADARDPIDWDQDGDTDDTVSFDCNGIPGCNTVENLDINRDRVCVDPGPDRMLQTRPARADAGQTIMPGVIGASFEAVVTGEDRRCNTTALATSDDVQAQSTSFAQPSTLRGHNDWANLCYTALLAGADCSASSRDYLVEPTLQQEEQLLEAQLAAVVEFLDTDAPVIEPTPDPPANEAGWWNGPVTFSFSCTDTESGVASCPDPVVVDTEGAGQSITVTAVDNVGNEATLVVGGINIDQVPPAIAFVGNEGVYGVDEVINISCTVTDSLSGVDVSSCASVSGPAYDFVGSNTISGSATDVAGNLSSAQATFTVAVEPAGTCALVDIFVTKVNTVNQLCKKFTDIAEASASKRQQKLKVFQNYLNAKTGKDGLTRAEADILLTLATHTANN